MLDLGAAAAPSLASAQLHGLQYEVMHGAEVNARYPGEYERVCISNHDMASTTTGKSAPLFVCVEH